MSPPLLTLLMGEFQGSLSIFYRLRGSSREDYTVANLATVHLQSLSVFQWGFRGPPQVFPVDFRNPACPPTCQPPPGSPVLWGYMSLSILYPITPFNKHDRIIPSPLIRIHRASLPACGLASPLSALYQLFFWDTCAFSSPTQCIALVKHDKHDKHEYLHFPC